LYTNISNIEREPFGDFFSKSNRQLRPAAVSVAVRRLQLTR